MTECKITIQHPTGQFPPDPKLRNVCIKEWQKVLQGIFKGNYPKTFEEMEPYGPEIEKAELEFRKQYEMKVVLERFDLEQLIEQYGPLNIGSVDGELYAFTQKDYQPKTGVKERVKKSYYKAKSKLQKLARKANRTK